MYFFFQILIFFQRGTESVPYNLHYTHYLHIKILLCLPISMMFIKKSAKMTVVPIRLFSVLKILTLLMLL